MKNKKKYLFTFIALLLLIPVFIVITSCKSNDYGNIQQGNSKDKIWHVIKNNIQNADSVHILLLNPELKDKNGFNGYKILKQKAYLSPKQLTYFVNILSDSLNFVKSKEAKNCTFLPDIGIKFYSQENKDLEVLIATYCDVINLHYKDSTYSFSCDKTHKQNEKILKEVFKGK